MIWLLLVPIVMMIGYMTLSINEQIVKRTMKKVKEYPLGEFEELSTVKFLRVVLPGLLFTWAMWFLIGFGLISLIVG